jgi:hypothetical protein
VVVLETMSVPSFDDTPDNFISFNDNAADSGGDATSRSSPYLHPIAVVFHLAFKIVAMIIYLVLTLVFSDTVSRSRAVPRKTKKKKQKQKKTKKEKEVEKFAPCG